MPLQQKWKPNAKGQPWSLFCPLFFHVADPMFVVSVQVCQFALAHHPPGYQENVPEEKNQSVFMVIRLEARTWISSFELHSWGRNRPGSQQSSQGNSPLPGELCRIPRALHPPLATKAGGETKDTEAPLPMHLHFPSPLTRTNCKGKTYIWQEYLYMNLCFWKK